MWKWAEEKKCDMLGLYLANVIVTLAIAFKLNSSIGGYGICMGWLARIVVELLK